METLRGELDIAMEEYSEAEALRRAADGEERAQRQRRDDAQTRARALRVEIDEMLDAVVGRAPVAHEV